MHFSCTHWPEQTLPSLILIPLSVIYKPGIQLIKMYPWDLKKCLAHKQVGTLSFSGSCLAGAPSPHLCPVFTLILSGLLAAVSCSFIWLPCGRTISSSLDTCKCLGGSSWLRTLSACTGPEGLLGPGNAGTKYRWVIRASFKNKCGKH